MRASELVAGDLAREGTVSGRPGDVWVSDRWRRPGWTIEALEAAKAGRTISVVLPALNEQDTVQAVIASVAPLLHDGGGGLIDELIVLDSGSTDDTEIRAVAAGARVVSREQALPEVPTRPGKGEALWRSLAASASSSMSWSKVSSEEVSRSKISPSSRKVALVDSSRPWQREMAPIQSASRSRRISAWNSSCCRSSPRCRRSMPAIGRPGLTRRKQRAVL